MEHILLGTVYLVGRILEQDILLNRCLKCLSDDCVIMNDRVCRAVVCQNALVEVLLDARRADAVPARHTDGSIKSHIHLFGGAAGQLLHCDHYRGRLRGLSKHLAGTNVHRVVRCESGALEVLQARITGNIRCNATAGGFRQRADNEDGVITTINGHRFGDLDIDLNDFVDIHVVSLLYSFRISFLTSTSSNHPASMSATFLDAALAWSSEYSPSIGAKAAYSLVRCTKST